MRKKPVTPAQIAQIKKLLYGGLELAEKSMLDPRSSPEVKDNNRQIRTIFLSCILVLDSRPDWNSEFWAVMLRICQNTVYSTIKESFDYDEFISSIKETISQFGGVVNTDDLEQLIHALIDLPL